MRPFGNHGSIRAGVFVSLNPFADWVWNHRWCVKFKLANGEIIKVKLTAQKAKNLNVLIGWQS